MSDIRGYTRRYEPDADTSAIGYHLATSRIEVQGTLRVVSTPAGSTTTAEGVEIAVASTAETGAPLSLEVGAGTQDLAVELTADGRLRTLTYQRVGAGPAVVSAGARLVGFVASVALRFVTGAIASGDTAPADQLAWPGEDLLQKAKDQADRAEERLGRLRDLVVEAETPARAREVDSLLRVVSVVLESTRADVGRLGALKATWLDAQRTERTAPMSTSLAVGDIATREPGRPVSEAPEPPGEGTALPLWRDFHLVLELVDAQRGAPAPATTEGGDRDRRGDYDGTVLWRVPRDAELWAWRAGSVEGQEDVLELVSRTSVRIVDSYSPVAGLELHDGAFGEHGLALTFADDGAPLSVTTSDKGAASAIANAIGGVPGDLAGAVAQAQEVVRGIDVIRDAGDERARAALERELAIAKTRNELLGLHATEGQAASLSRLQQRAAILTARRAVSPEAGELLALQDELAEVTTRSSLEAARRTGAVETDLAGLRAEVAALEAEVARARARWEIEHPDQVE